MISLSVSLSLGALLIAVPAWAHHSNSAFYVEKIVEFKGVITKWEWVNLHTFIYLSVDEATAARWSGRSRPRPRVLRRAGWRGPRCRWVKP